MPPNTQPVCDNCRLRKTRCDRAVPCSTCVGCALPCHYSHSIQRRGPKGGKGRRLALIKQGLASQAAQRTESNAQHTTEFIGAVSPHSLRTPDFSSLSSSPSVCASPSTSDDIGPVLAAHVEMFMAHLFPVMPVVDEVRLQADCPQPTSLPPSRLALLLALAAVTRIQLRLDNVPENLADEKPEPNGERPNDSPATRLNFLKAAEDARQKVNIADTMSEDAILTSFFLFVCYGNQEKHKQAWFYLNQSASMAILLELDNETAESVVGLTDQDIDRRRRIFWLLFISERTYALQRKMPVLLRRTVPKPRIFDSDYPIVMNDFVNHINLFESLPPDIYEWQPRLSGRSDVLHLGHQVMRALRAVQPQNSVLESQQFDTLITQHWLRVTMWRLIRGIASQYCSTPVALPESTLPFDAGSSIMSSLTSVSTTSKNRHGISLEQKLFDIGLSLVDVTPLSTLSAMALGPQDLFYAIVNTLSCIRGRQSHFLPKLLQHSEKCLGSTKMGWRMDMQLSTRQFTTRPELNQCEELPSDIFEVPNAPNTDFLLAELNVAHDEVNSIVANTSTENCSNMYMESSDWQDIG